MVQQSSLHLYSEMPSKESSQNVDKVVQSVTNATKRLSQISTNTNNSNKLKTQNRIGPWKLGRTLGRGSTGRVRLAKNVETGKFAAVKIVPKSNFRKLENPKYKRNSMNSISGHRRLPYGIEREIVIMKLISHPNIMGLYDVWENKNDLYLILEYIEGGELFDYLIKHGKLHEEEAIYYFKQIIRGISYLHQFNICHRDLKPENLLLDFNKRIKIADFGMAALEVNDKLLETSCGSPHYASPEIVAGKNYHGAPSDIWSCGIILFALLTGHLPFDDENIRKLLLKVQNGRFLMPASLSLEAKDLISKMLKVNPDERITINEILEHPLLKKYADPQIDHRRVVDYNHIELKPVKSMGSIDKGILKSLSVLFHNCSEQRIIAKLVSPEKCPEKTFYYLLLKYRNEHTSNSNYVDDSDMMSTSDSKQTLPRSTSIIKAITVNQATGETQTTIKRIPLSRSNISHLSKKGSKPKSEVLGNITNRPPAYKASNSFNKKKCVINNNPISRNTSCKSLKRISSRQKSLTMSRKFSGLGDLNTYSDEKNNKTEEENRRKLTGTFGNVSLLNFELLLDEVFDGQDVKEETPTHSQSSEGTESSSTAQTKSKMQRAERDLALRIHKNNDEMEQDLDKLEEEERRSTDHSMKRRENSKQRIFISNSTESPDMKHNGEGRAKRFFTEPTSLDPKIKKSSLRAKSLGASHNVSNSNVRYNSSAKVLRSLGVLVPPVQKNGTGSLKKTSSSKTLSSFLSNDMMQSNSAQDPHVPKEEEEASKNMAQKKEISLASSRTNETYVSKAPRSMLLLSSRNLLEKYKTNLSNIDENKIQKDLPVLPLEDFNDSSMISEGRGDDLIPNPRFSRFSFAGIFNTKLDRIDDEIVRNINTKGTIIKKDMPKQKHLGHVNTLKRSHSSRMLGLGINMKQDDLNESSHEKEVSDTKDSNIISFSAGSSFDDTKLMDDSDIGVVDFDSDNTASNIYTSKEFSLSASAKDNISESKTLLQDDDQKNHHSSYRSSKREKRFSNMKSSGNEAPLEESIKSMYKDYALFYDDNGQMKPKHNTKSTGGILNSSLAQKKTIDKEEMSFPMTHESVKEEKGDMSDVKREEMKYSECRTSLSGDTIIESMAHSQAEIDEEEISLPKQKKNEDEGIAQATELAPLPKARKNLPKSGSELESLKIIENPQQQLEQKDTVVRKKSLMRRLSVRPKRNAPRAPESETRESEKLGHKRFSRFSANSRVYPKASLAQENGNGLKGNWLSKFINVLTLNVKGPNGQKRKTLARKTDPSKEIVEASSYSIIESSLSYTQLMRVLRNTLDLKKMEGSLQDLDFDAEFGLISGVVPAKFSNGRKLKFRIEVVSAENATTMHITKLKGLEKSFKNFINVLRFSISTEEKSYSNRQI